MSKRGRSAEPEARTTIVDSVIVELKIDYEQTKGFAEGQAVRSDVISAGGHSWRIDCYPRGLKMSSRCKHLSILVEHLSKPRCAKAIVEAFLMDKHGNPSESVGKRSWTRQFETGFNTVGWPWFVLHKDLEDYIIDGQITILCAIMVLPGSSIPVPPSDIKKHLGLLLDSTDGTDVSFNIDGETFHAHRAVLAARSPVFKAELLGSMAEATMPSITLQDISPATFRAMLRFMYTDSLDVDNELGDTPSETTRDLLAAAGRYALDRLKLMCAQKLSERVCVDTVAATLACAEMHNCPELKNKCMDFYAKEENFKKAVLSKDFLQLGVLFPSIVDELRERVGL